MRTLISGIALLALAGCATSQPAGTWVSDGRGGYCYRQGAACSYTGAEPKANTSEKWWEFTAGTLKAINDGQHSFGVGVYPGK